MPSPGDKTYKIVNIALDATGQRSRVTVAVGVVPASGATQYAPRAVVLDLSGPQFDALRAVVASQLAASPPPALEGATLETV